MNAKVGKGANGETLSPFGLGTRNERGVKLEEFSRKNRMINCDTLFQHYFRKLYVEKSHRDLARNPN